jgi:predicted ATP-dependent protease
VGGVKMKVLAAHRAGLNIVIIPKQNEGDLDELPEDIRNALTFVPVELISEALQAALRECSNAAGCRRVKVRRTHGFQPMAKFELALLSRGGGRS